MTGRMLGVAVALVLLVASDARAQAGGLTALPAPEPGRNLVENGGFETASSGVPQGWQLKASGDAWSIDPSARSGRASLKLSGASRQEWIPSADQTVTLEPGYYTVEGWIKTSALGGERAGARICLDGRPRIDWWQCTEVAHGTVDWTHFREMAIPVRDRGAYRVTVGAYGRPDGTAWFDDVALVKLPKPALDAFLLHPNFRGMLFDDRPQTIRVAVALSDDARRLPGARVRLQLVDERTGSEKQRREYAAPDRTFVAELDGAPLDHGVFLLRVELVDGAGTSRSRYPDHRIVKAPAKTRAGYAVWYDEQNVTYLHGKPAFVLGLYNTTGYSSSREEYAQGNGGWGNARIAEAPINMLINYWLGAAPIRALETYMDDLVQRGIHLLHTVNFYYRDDPQYAKLPYPVAAKGEAALNEWVGKTLGRHRGLAGFYTADERTAEMVPKVFSQHRQLSAAAPGTVDYVVLGNGWEEQAPLWRDAADVIGLDPYPITRPAGQNDLAMVGEWTRLGREAVMGSRPLWMVIQYFPMTAAGGWPTREDLRTMSWMAIVDGAKGLFYWSFGAKGLAWVKDPRERERHWTDLVAVTKEIKSLEPVLLAPDASVAARDSSGGAVRALGKRTSDGTRYLFAYNSTKAPVQVTWTLAEPAREVTPLGPSAVAPTLAETALSDRLGPYEVRQYRLR
jgi:hypothetical protein